MQLVLHQIKQMLQGRKHVSVPTMHYTSLVRTPSKRMRMDSTSNVQPLPLYIFVLAGSRLCVGVTDMCGDSAHARPYVFCLAANIYHRCAVSRTLFLPIT